MKGKGGIKEILGISAWQQGCPAGPTVGQNHSRAFHSPFHWNGDEGKAGVWLSSGEVILPDSKTPQSTTPLSLHPVCKQDQLFCRLWAVWGSPVDPQLSRQGDCNLRWAVWLQQGRPGKPQLGDLSLQDQLSCRLCWAAWLKPDSPETARQLIVLGSRAKGKGSPAEHRLNCQRISPCRFSCLVSSAGPSSFNSTAA